VLQSLGQTQHFENADDLASSYAVEAQVGEIIGNCHAGGALVWKGIVECLNPVYTTDFLQETSLRHSKARSKLVSSQASLQALLDWLRHDPGHIVPPECKM
jgi:hypothetical protein